MTDNNPGESSEVTEPVVDLDAEEEKIRQLERYKELIQKKLDLQRETKKL
ncbi:hypothetical protein MCOR08_011519 [Pyricularia oryzae]|nr:hypothetical protein MCOR11_011746 [Pyricularia oryzae]KAI6579387.1 hypothetical protein MCOR12_011770 [Pyricularia oryzae]KAI6609055.1 hypothetical protein MCOR08_011519 [Pyricularia oryzae]